MKHRAAIACLAATALVAPFASAQAVAVTPSRQIAVAHDSVIELFAPDAKQRIWTAQGLSYVSTICIGDTKLAVVDAIDGGVVIADLANGRALALPVAGTPIAAVFVHDDLYLLERDTNELDRIAADGTCESAPTGRYPLFLRRSGGRLYVYAGGDGTLDEFATAPFARARSAAVPPFATGFESDASFAYLLYPSERKLVVFRLDSLTKAGDRTIGGFPIDLAILSGPEAVAPGETPYDLFVAYGKWFGQGVHSEPAYENAPAVLAVADPARESIFQVEVGRPGPPIGSLVAASSLAFRRLHRWRLPTAVDRVSSAGNGWVAYDSARRVVYAIVNGRAAPIAYDVGPHAFGARAGMVAFWNGVLVAQEL